MTKSWECPRCNSIYSSATSRCDCIFQENGRVTGSDHIAYGMKQINKCIACHTVHDGEICPAQQFVNTL